MKNYKQILEAVNRGIQLALDDFDDEEQVQNNIKSKQVQNRDYTKEYLNLMNDVVDFDLPSKTLWCKYNLGVNPNQLIIPEDWYGDYYAWGELEPNKTDNDGTICFEWSNYKYGNLSNKSTKYRLTKYCSDPDYGLKHFTDNLIQLVPEDDAAYQNKKLHNFKFHIPTEEQCKELIKYTNNYWINNYDLNKLKHNPEDDRGIKGLNGYIFEGKNGNQMFIPASSYYNGYKIDGISSEGLLWTSSLNLLYPNNAYSLWLTTNYIRTGSMYRCVGLPIRPVINL